MALDGQPRCGACLQATEPFATARAAFVYADSIAWLIRRYKFHANLAAGRVLGAHMARELERYLPPVLPDMLVPIPLHDQRLRERGFDQAVELSRDLGDRFDISVVAGIRRVRATAAQTASADVPTRRRNLRGAFVADPNVVAGRRIILVDDVMTTGSTVREAARALRAAGASEVDVWCCARTPRPG